ncbi:indolepyruvate ferredoxin oxidoreductase family protein [Saccharopolyspora sp. TS4A08]|uniref:Indolepyruvate ferredoxin oxidoreductase family protein n=1 Tax=Saccharopolyspora ipomoeae TaxID=3042027 RepID=A0ABT6PR52_9PSEU|nr:indolepyruvate ferredoxin oxidoreductase family protein [Saccharopolyspora sp. TS4A08]MDI2030143.1 indolepyruvate ferredoxin oxidoreductase family protein [Saccharopolyspora sp. TS4A08]
MSTPTREPVSLDSRYLAEDGAVYLTGVQALVRVLLDRSRHDRSRGHDGALYVSGYEGSPLAGYDLEIQRRSRLMDEHGIVHAPALNEELAATALAGTQLAGQVAELSTDGVTGFWYGKAPGLDRATDAIRHAAMTGTAPTGGVVALVGDDPSAKSSSVPCSSEPALADLQLPTFYPADSQEVLEHGLHAVELSRASGLWTAMKIATNVADGASTALLDPHWAPPGMDGLPGGLRAYSHVPHARLLGADLAGLERSFQQVRLPIALEYLRRSGVNRLLGARGAARVGIVAAGKTYLDVRQALDSLGLTESDWESAGIRLLKLGAIVPVEPGVVREFARGLDEIVVVEDKRAFLEVAVKDVLYGAPDTPRVTGKRDPEGARLFSDVGELDPIAVATGLRKRLQDNGFDHLKQVGKRPERIALPLAARTPYFCSGCPHNSSTAPPEGALVGGGIGCHAMVLLMPEEQVGSVTGLSQMGGEGAHWIGMAPFVRHTHYLQNLGDGTFAHSGSLAIRAAVAAGVSMTFKVLFNSTVAMTGGQDAVGGGGLAQLVRTVLAEGVTRVVVTGDQPDRIRKALRREGIRVDVRDRGDLVAVQTELAGERGVTVLVHDQECAAEKRRKRKRGTLPTPETKVVINERVCEGCGDCGQKSNCLSVRPVDTEFGRKTRIHQSSCNLDYSCLDGDCPSFLTVVPGKNSRGRDSFHENCAVSGGQFPGDRRPVGDDSFHENCPLPGPRDTSTRSRVPTSGEVFMKTSRSPGEDGFHENCHLPTTPSPVPEVSEKDFTVRITGVGGTGVVTVAQVLATAASLDGRHVRALDQTGLAQKGGAVVSDVKISDGPIARAAKLADGECDLYLGCDSLVATDPTQLKATDPDRTIAVVSTAEVPTGHMVVDPSVTFPEQDRIRSAVAEHVRRAHHVDADRLALELFDDEQFANMLLVGAAFQAGALPLSAEAVERAIRLNGVRVEENLAAFAHGRNAVAGPVETESAPRGLDELIADRTAELTAYQNARYAEDYRRFVHHVRDREHAATGTEELTEAVARNLFKLMAYKDEYEVARLSLDPEVLAGVREQWGAGARVSYRLHPPLLRALGMRRKIALGPWFRPVFRVLRGMRGLRGTPFDPFGRAHVRKVERELIGEYRRAVEEGLPSLTDTTLPGAVELAELPDLIRGYEQIKLDSVQRYRQRLGELRDTRTHTDLTAQALP